MFGTTYRCEAGFSTLKRVKNEYKTQLMDQNLDKLLRVKLSGEHIDLDELIAKPEVLNNDEQNIYNEYE